MSDIDAAYQQKVLNRSYPPIQRNAEGTLMMEITGSGPMPEGDGAPSGSAMPKATAEPQMTEQMWRTDPALQSDLNTAYTAFTGKPAPDPDTLAQWGIEKISNFNLALGDITDPTGSGAGGGMIGQATQILNDFTPEQAGAFARLLEAHDQLPTFTLPGFGRFVRNIAADPTSVIGVATLGAGMAGRQAAKEGVKQALRQRIGNAILTNPIKVGAGEAAAYTGAGDVLTQKTKVKGGTQQEYSPLQTAGATALGATLGAGMMKGAQKVGQWVSKLLDNQIKLDGNEFGEGLSGKELRKVAMQFGKDHFVGKSFINDKTKDEISVPWQGVKHALSGGASDPEIRVFYALPDILKHMDHVATEAPKSSQKDISSVHRYATTAVIAGEHLDIGVIVFEDKSGHRFYDHFVIKEVTPAGTSGAASLRAQEKLGVPADSRGDVSVVNSVDGGNTSGKNATKPPRGK